MKRHVVLIITLFLGMILLGPVGNIIPGGNGESPEDNNSKLDGPSTYEQEFYIPPSNEMPIYFKENFEYYGSGEDILNSQKWFEDDHSHLSSDTSDFTATTEGPIPQPSPHVGRIYNHNDDYSFVLSHGLNLREGVVEGWMAADQIFYGEVFAMSSMISLMVRDSVSLEFEDRAVTLLMRDGGFGYRLKPQREEIMIVSSGIEPNTWYRFRIAFNCSMGSADISIYDSDDILLGKADDTPFMCSADSIRRLELTTARDRDGVYTTSYWDDITIYRSNQTETNEIHGKGAVLPGFEVALILVALSLVAILVRRKTW